MIGYISICSTNSEHHISIYSDKIFQETKIDYFFVGFNFLMGYYSPSTLRGNGGLTTHLLYVGWTGRGSELGLYHSGSVGSELELGLY